MPIAKEIGSFMSTQNSPLSVHFYNLSPGATPVLLRIWQGDFKEAQFCKENAVLPLPANPDSGSVLAKGLADECDAEHS